MLRLSTLVAIAALTLSSLGQAAPLPYDAAADARLELRQALAAAKATRSLVLVVFGANWCEDCRALDRALHAPANAAWLAAEFRVVKVDVGRFDRNLDLARIYGDPVRHGIPAVLVLSPENNVVYATRAGELAQARRMGEAGLRDFLRRIAAARRP